MQSWINEIRIKFWIHFCHFIRSCKCKKLQSCYSSQSSFILRAKTFSCGLTKCLKTWTYRLSLPFHTNVKTKWIMLRLTTLQIGPYKIIQIINFQKAIFHKTSHIKRRLPCTNFTYAQHCDCITQFFQRFGRQTFLRPVC